MRRANRHFLPDHVRRDFGRASAPLMPNNAVPWEKILKCRQIARSDSHSGTKSLRRQKTGRSANVFGASDNMRL